MQRQQQGPKSRWSDLSESLRALAPDHVVPVLGQSLYKHQLALWTEILYAQQSAASHLLVLVIKTLIEEGQQVPRLQVSDRVIRGLLVQYVQREEAALAHGGLLVSKESWLIANDNGCGTYLEVWKRTSMTKSILGLLTLARAKARMMHSLSL